MNYCPVCDNSLVEREPVTKVGELDVVIRIKRCSLGCFMVMYSHKTGEETYAYQGNNYSSLNKLKLAIPDSEKRNLPHRGDIEV